MPSPNEDLSYNFQSIAGLESDKKNIDEINGVVLPMDVKAQLREIGLSLESYTQGELKEVIVACADGHLIDDPNGVNWTDKLKLTAGEVENRFADNGDNNNDDDDNDNDSYQLSDKKSYTKILKHERAKKREAIASGDFSHTDIPVNN